MGENNRYRFVIQASVILVRTCIGLIWASAGPLLPVMMQAFGIGQGSAGWFAAAAPLTIAIVSIPAGMIGARYSLKKTFAVGAFLQSGGVLASLASTYVPVLFTRVLFAVGTAVTVPMATAIAAQWFTNRKLPVVNGLTMAFVNLANAIATVATVPIATIFSWKAPMVIYGAYALTCAIAWVILGRDKPKTEIVPRAITGQAARAPRPDLGFRQVLGQRSTLVLAGAVMGSWCLGNSIGSWLPTYYHKVFQMPLEQASSILSLVTVGGTAACIAGGILPLRIGRRLPFIIIPGIFMGLTALCAVLFRNPLVIYTSVALFGVFSNLQTPSLFTIPMELPGSSIRSGVVVMSVMQCGGNLGNFIGPLLVGYLADMTGSFLPGFFVAAAVSLSLLVSGLMLPETGPRARKPVGEAQRTSQSHGPAAARKRLVTA